MVGLRKEPFHLVASRREEVIRMPNCFTLTRKGENEPSELAEVDNQMRLHFGAPPDDVHWFKSWYDITGLALACGIGWDKIRETCPGQKEVVDWLEANYTTNAWYQSK